MRVMPMFFQSLRLRTPSRFAALALAATGLLLPAGASIAGAIAESSPALVELQPRAAVQTAIDAFRAAHSETFVNLRAGAITRVYGNAFSHAATPIDSADAFVHANAAMFGVLPTALAPIGPFADGSRVLPLVYDTLTNSYKFTLVAYSQYLDGVPVFRADLRVLVRNEAGFPAVLASSSIKDLGAFASNFKGGPIGSARGPRSIDQAKLLRAIGNQFRQQPTLEGAEQVIWAGVDDQPEAPRLAYKVVAEGGLVFQPASYKRFLYIVDAETGRILFQEDQVCSVDVSGSVNGLATQGSGADFCGEELAEPLPYAKVTLGAVTAYADSNGNFVATGVDAATSSASSQIGGLYFKLVDASGVANVTMPLAGGPVDFVHNAPNTDALVRAQVNAYVHANIIRDLVLAQNPSYPVISGQSGTSAFTINSNLQQTCNAFYNGSSINFYKAGGGCSNTAFSTVVHHEFGHHVVQSGGSGQGAYGEGMADCMAVLVTDESLLAQGFQNDCAAGLRDANNSCQFLVSGCSTCGSAIHACGQLLSGCVWDLRLNWAAQYPDDYRDRLSSIVVNSVPLHGPITTIGADITIDFLTLNDDNANIADGTPDYFTIADAFAQHGLPAPALQLIKFTFPAGIPTAVDPDGTTTLNVNVEPLAGAPSPGTGTFRWRSGTSGAFSSTAMSQIAPNQYEVAIPAALCPGTVQFYVQAKTTSNLTISEPVNAPASFFAAVSAFAVTTTLNDDFETSVPGWQAGVASDTATSGQWVRVNPNGTAAQPENDHSAVGTQCYITGQGPLGGALDEADVDGGETTLLSPLFSGLEGDTTFVSYWRWYSDDTGPTPNTDSMPVEISNDGGATWTLLENVNKNNVAWVFKSFKVSNFVVPTATMRLRWRARDLGAESVVEAGVDDFNVTSYDCVGTVLGDLNDDGVVDAADLAILLGAWGVAGAADLDGDGTVGAEDLAILLGEF